MLRRPCPAAMVRLLRKIVLQLTQKNREFVGHSLKFEKNAAQQVETRHLCFDFPCIIRCRKVHDSIHPDPCFSQTNATLMVQIEAVKLAADSKRKHLEAELANAKRDAAQAATAHKTAAAVWHGDLDFQKAEVSDYCPV